MIFCYCFGGLLQLNVSGAIEVMDSYLPFPVTKNQHVVLL
jgi:hypothetical protein